MNLKRKVYIVIPSCHGNGGWCGYHVLTKKPIQLKTALKIRNPYEKYDEYDDYLNQGSLAAIRICSKPDPNESLYFFNSDDYKWEKI